MRRILIIYTGGTIGMVHDSKTNSLKPFDFEKITAQVPELSRFDYQISAHSFHPLIDSSNMQPNNWIELVKTIEKNYNSYDGFVILHGTDTMAYTASALSFMLENLQKPIILTGSQLPIGEIRTDAKENLITAIEIAAAQRDDLKSIIQEVCIFFDYKLFRGNRSSKFSSSKFEAFHSPNFPSLAETGVHIRYKKDLLKYNSERNLKTYINLDKNIGLLKIFPGMSEGFVRNVISTPGLKALVLETFGAGNAPTDDWFIKLLQSAIKNGLIILNITQCGGGAVEQGRYETSVKLKEIGVISGRDMTTESAITKLMFLLGNYRGSVKEKFQKSLCGEISL